MSAVLTTGNGDDLRSSWWGKPHPTLALAIVLALMFPLRLAAEPEAAARTSGRDGHDWPRFLGPTGDGKSAETILRDWPAEGLPVLWHETLGEGYSAPSVAGGRVFVFDRVGDEARIRALADETGEELWTATYPTAYEDYYRYSGGPRASPVIDDGRVYVYGVEGRLRSHAAADGKLLWEVDTTERFAVVQNFFGVGSNPVVEGDLLIVQVGGSPPGSPRIHSGEVKGNIS